MASNAQISVLFTAIASAVFLIILLIILLSFYSTTVPIAQESGDDINVTGVPLGSLFTGNSIVFIIIMAALFITIFITILKNLKFKN